MPNEQFVASVYTLYNYLISHTSIPLCLSELSLEETKQMKESTHHQKKGIIRLIPYNNLKFYLMVRSVYGQLRTNTNCSVAQCTSLTSLHQFHPESKRKQMTVFPVSYFPVHTYAWSSC